MSRTADERTGSEVSQLDDSEFTDWEFDEADREASDLDDPAAGASTGAGAADTGAGAADTNGPTGALPSQARRAFAALLRWRFITRERHRPVWDALVSYRPEIEARLADMFLVLEMNEAAGVAFKRQDPAEGAPAMLRRERPLSRDASLLLIHLAKEQLYTDDVSGPATITRAQIAEFMRPFREDGDGDEARFEKRVDSAVRALRDLSLLEADPDAEYLFTISPVVGPLIGPDELMRFERYFSEAASGAAATPGVTAPATAPAPAADSGDAA